MKTRLALALLFLAALAAPVFAQDWRMRIEESLTRKKSYEFEEQAVGDVLRGIARDADVNLIVDEGAVDRFSKVTLKVKDMNIANVLTWVTRLGGLQWCIQDEAIYITREDRLDEAARRQTEERNRVKFAAAERSWLPAYNEALARTFTVTLTQKPLSDVRDSLQALLGVNVILSPKLDAKTSINLSVKEMTAESILGWIARKVAADYVVFDQAVYFAPAEEIRVMRGAGFDFSSRGRAYHNVVSYDFADVPLDQAYADLAKKAGIEIRIRGDVSPLPAVTASGKDVPFQAAIQAVTDATGLNKVILVENGTYIVHLMNPVPKVLPTAPAPVAPTAEPAPRPARMPWSLRSPPLRRLSRRL